MTFEELKSIVDNNKSSLTPEQNKRLAKEMIRAKFAYSEGVDIVDEIKKLYDKGDLSDNYVIPFLLGYTKEIHLENPIEVKQIRPGDSGGLDIDTDVCASGKPLIKKYLEEKYGKNCVLSVGAYSTEGLKRSISDALRGTVSAQELIQFSKNLDDELSLEENMKIYEKKFPELYDIYLQNANAIEQATRMKDIIRGVSKHAGGILILPEPRQRMLPVVRVKDTDGGYEMASAFVENGSATDLDSIGATKYDILGLQTLDIISDTLKLVEESGDSFYEIEDDEGKIQIVSGAYLRANGINPDEENY